MRKGVSAAQNIAFLKFAREYGIYSAYNILVGFPNEPPNAYDSFIRQIPRLFHLQPPSGITVVEYHRFSPYHNNPERFGIELEPNPYYKMLYPFEMADLANIVYRFVRTDLQGGLPHMPYQSDMQQAIFLWRNKFDGEYPLLLWYKVDKDIEILDSRNGSKTLFRIGGIAADVFLLLDKPRTIADLRRQVASCVEVEDSNNELDTLIRLSLDNAIPICFNRQTFLAEPEACLSLLDDAGLVFRDNTVNRQHLYVALPLAHYTQPIQRDWLGIGI